MKPIPAALVLIALAAGCSKPAPQNKAASDAAAVAMVEKAQKLHPDPVTLAPQAIALADIKEDQTPAAGCEFRLRSAWMDYPIAMAGHEKGSVKIREEVVTLAADSGSAQLAPNSREKYVGRTVSMRLTRGPGKGTPVSGATAGASLREWPGSLTLTDKYDRIVYFTPGVMICGA